MVLGGRLTFYYGDITPRECRRKVKKYNFNNTAEFRNSATAIGFCFCIFYSVNILALIPI